MGQRYAFCGLEIIRNLDGHATVGKRPSVLSDKDLKTMETGSIGRGQGVVKGGGGLFKGGGRGCLRGGGRFRGLLPSPTFKRTRGEGGLSRGGGGFVVEEGGGLLLKKGREGGLLKKWIWGCALPPNPPPAFLIF